MAFVLAACNPGRSPAVIPNTPKATSLALEQITPPATVKIAPTHTAPPQPTETASPTVTSTPDFFAQVYPLSDNEYVIPLTVRHVGDEHATFFFDLQNPADGKLVYRSMDSRDHGAIAFSAVESRHMITAEGLIPGTAYEAMVLLGNEATAFQQPGFSGEAWGAIHFHTVSGQWPLRVGVLGDASFGDQATQKLVDLMATQNLDFVIHTGDVVYETDPSDVFSSYLLKFFEPFAPLLHQGPVYTVLGNHDYDRAVRWEGVPFYDYAFAPFPDSNFSYPETRRGNQYYAFAYQDIQFLMLDTHVFAGAEGRLEQDTWLEERLSDTRYRITIPVFHVAPFSSSVVHPEDGLPIRYSWNRRFEAAKVPLVLSGHFHHYERLTANGITYMVSGGGSLTLYARGELLPESQIYIRKTHFVLLEFYERSIELLAISVDGEIIDQASIPFE